MPCSGSGHVERYIQPANRDSHWLGGVKCNQCFGAGAWTVRKSVTCTGCHGTGRVGPDWVQGSDHVDYGESDRDRDRGDLGSGPGPGPGPKGSGNGLAALVLLGLAAWGLVSGWNWWQERSARSAAADQRTSLEQRGIPYLTGAWSGSYTCAQGLTAAQLQLTSAADGTVAGRFEFSPYAGMRGGRGAFEVTGTPQGNTVTLRGGKWIYQSAGYRTIDLRVALAKGPPRRLEGRVLTPGCGAVELQEVRTP